VRRNGESLSVPEISRNRNKRRDRKQKGSRLIPFSLINENPDGSEQMAKDDRPAFLAS